MSDVPGAATALLKTLSTCVPAWSVYAHASTGTAEFTGFGEPRGDGTRPQIQVTEDVDSYLVRARHVDGRVFVAVWLCRLSRPTKAGGKSWTLDTAWRGRRPDEHTPKQIKAAELKAYVSEPSELEEEAA